MENTIIFGKTKCAKKFTGKENQILVIDDFENSISAVVMFFFTKFEREIESFLYDENATPEKLAEKILEIFKTLFLTPNAILVILMDYNLPQKKNGIDVISEIRKSKIIAEKIWERIFLILHTTEENFKEKKIFIAAKNAGFHGAVRKNKFDKLIKFLEK